MAEVTLFQKQVLFVQLLPKLFTFAQDSGYQLTLGEAYRTDEQAELNAMGPVLRGRVADMLSSVYPVLGTKIRNNPRIIGARNSLHTVRLAIDLNLFRSGIYLEDTDSFKPLGDYWKTLHPLARWGGDFGPPAGPDGGHFSLTHNGQA